MWCGVNIAGCELGDVRCMVNFAAISISKVGQCLGHRSAGVEGTGGASATLKKKKQRLGHFPRRKLFVKGSGCSCKHAVRVWESECRVQG